VGHLYVVFTFLEGDQFLVVYCISYLLQTMLNRARLRGCNMFVRVVEFTRWLNGWRHVFAVLFESTEVCDFCKYMVYVVV